MLNWCSWGFGASTGLLFHHQCYVVMVKMYCLGVHVHNENSCSYLGLQYIDKISDKTKKSLTNKAKRPLDFVS